ncbi:complement decay-accelerating factor-like [Natator depressus]|uniref:complement decay-accelerating factor-like n=1 Tax=Natator depressus TaxID=27790 RepID=UPI003EBB3F72
MGTSPEERGGTSAALVLPEVALPRRSLGSRLGLAWRIGPLMVFVAAAARPFCCHPLWLLGFVVLLPGACSQCGSLPRLSHAIPPDTIRTEGFPINTEVTYRCLDGFVKIPGKSDTVVCLSNSQWSNIEEFCGRSCLAPPRLKSAELSQEDLRKNYYPVGTTVSYVCRLAYESTGLRPVITCLENLTWAEAPEFCLGKSCGVPESPEHGRLVDATNNRFGAKVNIICDDGYKVSGRLFIQCLLNRDQVEWSKLPTCQSITCSPPPHITNGMHNGSRLESFDYNSSVTYKCDPNFSLTGEASIHCTTEDNINGVWNGSVPECKGLVIRIDIGIGTSIGIVVLVAVAAIIPLAILKNTRVKVGTR